MDLGPDWACFGPSHFVGLEPPTLLHGDSSPHSGWASRAVVGRPQVMFLDPGMLAVGPRA